MKTTFFVIALAFLTVVPVTTQAQTISASTTASADTDVLNNGTTILAYSANGSATTTPVNGVTFSGDATQNGVTFSLVGDTSSYAGAGVGSGLSPEYTAVLSTIVYNFSTSFDLQLTNLTPGETYIAQIFGGDSGTSKPGAESVTDDTNGTNATNTLTMPYTGTEAAYLFDTFKANASGTETIKLASTGDSGSFPVFDAINLQAAVAPEPSTWALMASGLIILVCFGRTRLTV